MKHKNQKYDVQKVKDFAQNHKVEEIAEEFGISIEYTRQFLRNNKIVYQKHRYPAKEPISTDIKINAIKFLLKEGHFSLYEVANLIRCPSAFVYKTHKQMVKAGEL